MPMPRPTALRAAAIAVAATAAGAAGLAMPAVSSAHCVDEQGNLCPPPAKAFGTVTVNPATTLGVRHVPKQDAKQFRQLKNRTRVGILCQTRGSQVSGTYGTTRIWDKLTTGGYVSDAYVYTGKDTRVAPHC